MCHPSNKDIGVGSISKQMGWICTTPFDDYSNAGNAIFSEREHGMCEMYAPQPKPYITGGNPDIKEI